MKAPTPRTALAPGIAKVLKRLHYPLDVILMCVCWYVAYGLSLRNLEEMMAERGVDVDHSTVHRRAIKLLPALEKVFRVRKHPVGKSCRADETSFRPFQHEADVNRADMRMWPTSELNQPPFWRAFLFGLQPPSRKSRFLLSSVSPG
nr:MULTISPECIES: transposase [Paraburkholderia]